MSIFATDGIRLAQWFRHPTERFAMSDSVWPMGRPRSVPTSGLTRYAPPAGPKERAARARRSPDWLVRLAVPLLILLVWQGGSSAGLISPHSLASPLRIVRTFGELTYDGPLLDNLLISLLRVVTGLAIAIAIGVPLALLSGLSRLGENIVDAPLQAARTLPHLALVPLFIVWFGIGETPKVALVVLGALFPIYLNLRAGIRDVDPRLLELARTLRLSRSAVIRHIVLPGALAQGLTGLRQGVGIAWLSLVVAEQINASSGIGFMMMDARDFMRTDIIVVGLLVYAGLGLITDAGVRALEQRALRWRADAARS